MRSKTETTNRFELPGTTLFLIISLKHPRLYARVFLQPLSHRFHRYTPTLAVANRVPTNRLRPLEKLQAEKRGWTLLP
jgi:hypothetical protein